ncbi:MAG: DNA polymerase III subunit delta [Rhodobacterales bacterium CG15_BIG_FIL_POST_REV_8_21_14_020_59_13]|nr:MAG: DNA polymerase III subunit delta [Rhodobacterales bacterium CG15_BIG_FIL_POST_REV_8_21_14_020_59_13]
MKATARDVNTRLAQPDRELTAWLIYGPDRGLVRERANALVKALVEDPDDPFNVTKLTDEDLKADPAVLADNMAALSMLGGDRLVRVQISSEAGGAPIADFLKDFEAGRAPAEAWLVVEAGDLKPAGKLRKTFEPAKKALAAPCYAETGRDLASFTDEALGAEGLTLEAAARARFLPLIEGDRGVARSEIDKLILYKGPKDIRSPGEDTITLADIEACAAAGGEAALDRVVETAMSGRVREADASLARALAGGASGVGLVRTIQRRIDLLSEMKAGGADAALRLGAPRFGPAADAFKQQAALWSDRALDQARQAAFEAERQMKRAGAAPAELLGGDLLLKLALRAEAMSARR